MGSSRGTGANVHGGKVRPRTSTNASSSQRPSEVSRKRRASTVNDSSFLIGESATGKYINSVLQVRAKLSEKDIHSLGRYRRKKNSTESTFITKLMILVCKAVRLVEPRAEKPWTDTSDVCQSTPWEVLNKIIAADPSKELFFPYSSASALLPPPPHDLPSKHPTRILYTWLTTFCEYSKQLTGGGSVRGSVDESESIATTAPTEGRTVDDAQNVSSQNLTGSSRNLTSADMLDEEDLPPLPSPLTAETLRRKEEAERSRQADEISFLVREQLNAVANLFAEERLDLEDEEGVARHVVAASERTYREDKLELERFQRNEAHKKTATRERLATQREEEARQREEEARHQREQSLRDEEQRAATLRQQAEQALLEQKRELESLRLARRSLEKELKEEAERKKSQPPPTALLKLEEQKLRQAQEAHQQMEQEASFQREELAKLMAQLQENRAEELRSQHQETLVRDAERERVEQELHILRVRQEEDALRVELLETRVEQLVKPDTAILSPSPSPTRIPVFPLPDAYTPQPPPPVLLAPPTPSPPADTDDAPCSDAEVRIQALCALAWQQYHCVAACCTFLRIEVPEEANVAVLMTAIDEAERFGSEEPKRGVTGNHAVEAVSPTPTPGDALYVPRLQGCSPQRDARLSVGGGGGGGGGAVSPDEASLRTALLAQHRLLVHLAHECDISGMRSDKDPALQAVILSGSASLLTEGCC